MESSHILNILENNNEFNTLNDSYRNSLSSGIRITPTIPSHRPQPGDTAIVDGVWKTFIDNDWMEIFNPIAAHDRVTASSDFAFDFETSNLNFANSDENSIAYVDIKTKYQFEHDGFEIWAIAAIGNNFQIGYQDKLPWHNKKDLTLFKKIIKDNVIILGENTFKGMPKSIFKTCTSIVITQLEDLKCDYVADSVEDAISIAKDINANGAIICGGAMVYKYAIEKKLINKLFISHINYDGPGDRFFPNFLKNIKCIDEKFTIIDQENRDNDFEFAIYSLFTNEDTLQRVDFAEMKVSYNKIEEPKWRSEYLMQPPFLKEYNVTLSGLTIQNNDMPVYTIGHYSPTDFFHGRKTFTATLILDMSLFLGEKISSSSCVQIEAYQRNFIHKLESFGFCIDRTHGEDNNFIVHISGVFDDLRSLETLGISLEGLI